MITIPEPGEKWMNKKSGKVGEVKSVDGYRGGFVVVVYRTGYAKEQTGEYKTERFSTLFRFLESPKKAEATEANCREP